jgi:hypothetical protein
MSRAGRSRATGCRSKGVAAGHHSPGAVRGGTVRRDLGRLALSHGPSGGTVELRFGGVYSRCLSMGRASRRDPPKCSEGPGCQDRRTIAGIPLPSHSGAYGSYRSASCRTPLSVLCCVGNGAAASGYDCVERGGSHGQFEPSFCYAQPGGRWKHGYVLIEVHGQHQRRSPMGSRIL